MLRNSMYLSFIIVIILARVTEWSTLEKQDKLDKKSTIVL